MSLQRTIKSTVLTMAVSAIAAGPAFAQAKPLSALSKADELFIEYQFSNSVKWCFNHWRMMLIDPRHSMRTMIDVDMREGSITFEDKGLSRKVICEQTGMRTIFDGKEKFERYP